MAVCLTNVKASFLVIAVLIIVQVLVLLLLLFIVKRVNNAILPVQSGAQQSQSQEQPGLTLSTLTPVPQPTTVQPGQTRQHRHENHASQHTIAVLVCSDVTTSHGVTAPET